MQHYKELHHHLLRPWLLRPWLRAILPMLFAWGFVLWLSTPAQAGTIQVDGTNCTLPEAITSANNNSAATGCFFEGAPGDDLLVLTPGATYVLTSTHSSATGTPTVVSTITISGTESIVTRDPTFACASNLFRIFRVAIGGNLTLHNLTVQNGCVNDHGGAIYVTGGKLTLSDVIVQSSHALGSNNGGALYNRPNAGNPGEIIILNSAILSNTATNHAGAVFTNGNAKTTVINSSIISNTATKDGGGFFVNGTGTTLISDTLLLRNVAFDQGGGIFNEVNAKLAITNTQIVSNSSSADGGGLYNNVGSNGTLVISNTQFLSNTAAQGGGIFNSPPALLCWKKSPSKPTAAITVAARSLTKPMPTLSPTTPGLLPTAAQLARASSTIAARSISPIAGLRTEWQQATVADCLTMATKSL